MQLSQLLFLAGVATAHVVQTVTEVATATPVVVVDCTTPVPAVHTSSVHYNATQTIVVTAHPANTTGKLLSISS